jgi:tyrosine-protein kinase Etk/Wzc
MIDSDATTSQPSATGEELSLLALGSVVLRWRRIIVGMAVAGMVIGAARGVLSPRLFVSSARFLPQGAENQQTELVAAASRFGIRVPASGGAWTPAIYVELLQSPTLLEPIVGDTIVVAELQNKRAAVLDLLKIGTGSPSRRLDLGVRKLAGMITAEEVRSISAVRVSAETPWPSVSLQIVERLVLGVNQFNLQTRKSQASAERQFVEARAVQAAGTLRVAEDALQSFQERNKIIPPQSELGLDRDRLKRDVDRLQEVYSSLLQNREEARIREVRDTPVITILEQPRMPMVPEGRGTVSKALLGGIAGIAVALLIAFIVEGFATARREPSDEAREFFRLVDESKPRRFRQGGR